MNSNDGLKRKRIITIDAAHGCLLDAKALGELIKETVDADTKERDAKRPRLAALQKGTAHRHGNRETADGDDVMLATMDEEEEEEEEEDLVVIVKRRKEGPSLVDVLPVEIQDAILQKAYEGHERVRLRSVCRIWNDLIFSSTAPSGSIFKSDALLLHAREEILATRLLGPKRRTVDTNMRISTKSADNLAKIMKIVSSAVSLHLSRYVIPAMIHERKLLAKAVADIEEDRKEAGLVCPSLKPGPVESDPALMSLLSMANTVPTFYFKPVNYQTVRLYENPTSNTVLLELRLEHCAVHLYIVSNFKTKKNLDPQLKRAIVSYVRELFPQPEEGNWTKGGIHEYATRQEFDNRSYSCPCSKLYRMHGHPVLADRVGTTYNTVRRKKTTAANTTSRPRPAPTPIPSTTLSSVPPPVPISTTPSPSRSIHMSRTLDFLVADAMIAAGIDRNSRRASAIPPSPKPKAKSSGGGSSNNNTTTTSRTSRIVINAEDEKEEKKRSRLKK